MDNAEDCEVTEVSVGIAEADNIDMHNVAEGLPNGADDTTYNSTADHSNENSADGHEGISNSSVSADEFSIPTLLGL